MTKRLLCCVSLLALLFASVSLSRAASAANYELARCHKIFSYSGGTAAYFYGFYGTRLVSVRAIPDGVTRTVDAAGNILCACHDDNNVYGLFLTSRGAYATVQMNMNSGACNTAETARGRTMQHTSIAALDGEVFVIVVDGTASYALGTRGAQEYTYRFPRTINRLFVSGNAAYTLLDGGAVYRMGNGSATAVSGVLPDDTATSVCANGITATLETDFSVTTRDNASPQEELPGGVSVAGDILTVAANTTVRGLQTQLGAPLTVRDADGSNVGSGKLKTGFTAHLGSQSYCIAVLGDVNGSGTLNSADTAALMRYFVGSESLSPAALRAADYNNDGSADHRDLVLIARAAP